MIPSSSCSRAVAAVVAPSPPRPPQRALAFRRLLLLGSLPRPRPPPPPPPLRRPMRRRACKWISALTACQCGTTSTSRAHCTPTPVGPPRRPLVARRPRRQSPLVPQRSTPLVPVGEWRCRIACTTRSPLQRRRRVGGTLSMRSCSMVIIMMAVMRAGACRKWTRCLSAPRRGRTPVSFSLRLQHPSWPLRRSLGRLGPSPKPRHSVQSASGCSSCRPRPSRHWHRCTTQRLCRCSVPSTR